ncbi:MAG: Peptide chain release factor 2 [Candidatus Uhrbacteria bacterium GW2011_GWE2_45_35]|uniref:Peptide chain release factor 2 n=2 Tax=Candidatus Uhriibacteriota TaxID=1752732 RepID=A0A0G1JK16_9BACT|nr:MAG: Peptide chain release factor 2 [Candidatus Uhrbacteria bacterium GW2011_GWF2_44_350]KKU08449.1 MAG: Peptide chain release factor 2 [Candidatus Uhrbacteria bacterium GW2011_GWE2_45_35]
MTSEGFWSNQEKAKAVSKKAADLRGELETWENLKKDLLELKELADLNEENLREEIEAKFVELEKLFSGLEFNTLFAGPHDQSNAIVSIHAGVGGTEAMDWAEMLFRMLTRFAEKKNFNVDILWESRGEEAGYKSITFRVAGRYAFGYLQSEAGVHRLVRISPFDAEKMRHTSFALVEVIPELEEISETEIDPKDLRIDTFMSGGKGGQSVNTTYSAVRIVHIPTNTTVQCQNERSQQQNKETALKILASKLRHLQEQELAAEKKKLRGEYKSAEWGNQIRSYVLQPYQMVKDHRTDFETPDTQGVLDGDIESFAEAYLRKQIGESDRWAEANQE